MDALEYIQKTGNEPTQDDLSRVNCERVGDYGHYVCGWCEYHDKPRHTCGCTYIKSATVQEGNVWMHPEFNVSVDDDNDIVIETETTVMSYQIAAARDLVQALTQAIAAAELMQVQDDAK